MLVVLSTAVVTSPRKSPHSSFRGFTLTDNHFSVLMPDLNDVVGTFTVTSTTDISDECTTLKENAPEPTGNGNIQGKFQCTSNNNNANTGSASGGTSSTGSSTGNSSSAAMLHINSAAMGLSFVGLLAQLL